MRKIKVVLVAIALIFVIVLIGLTSTKKEEVNEVSDQVVVEVKHEDNESVNEESDNVILLKKKIIEDVNPEYYLYLSTTLLINKEESKI